MATEFQTILDALERLAPAKDAKVVAPSASPLPNGVCDALLVIAAGNLSFTTKEGTTIPSFPVTAGQLITIQCSHVLSVTGNATVLAYY